MVAQKDPVRFSSPLSRVLAAALTSLIWVPAGCSVDGSPAVAKRSTETSSAPDIRQTDSRGVELPFTTPFPNRWSAANDDRSLYQVSYDITLDGRHVLVDSSDAMACMTTVKSGRSPVLVRVSKLFKPIGREAVCKRAIDFTRLVIDRMPPAER